MMKLTVSIMLAAAALPVFAQTSADDAANAAQQVAAQADSAFERVDPDQALIDSDEAALIYAGLPPLVADSAPPVITIAPAILEPAQELAPELAPELAAQTAAPRGPAVREIAQPIPAVSARKPPARTPAVRNDPFVIKSILPIEGAIRYGDWFWDESAAPGAGKLVITVDLDARVISAFRDGHEIGTAVTLLGTQKHPTPLGTFPILTKERDNVSEKYDNAPMPWTLRLTWDGIAIHGSPVLNGYASHGCVGVPDEFAAKLFAAAKRGDTVIITRGRMIGVGDKVL